MSSPQLENTQGAKFTLYGSETNLTVENIGPKNETATIVNNKLADCIKSEFT